MREHRATRTLVKSAPELWLTCSEESLLGRHLEPFGEITITRLEPESTVAWEGEAASGTVQIEPSGWGTRVTLTAVTISGETEPVAAELGPGGPAEPTAGEGPPEQTASEELPQSIASEKLPEPSASGEPPEQGQPPEDTASSEPPEQTASRDFWSRMVWRIRRSRRGRPHAVTAPADESLPTPVLEPRPEPAAEARSEDMNESIAQVVEPDAEVVEPDADVGEPPFDLEAALTAALDSLGAAHHRPFSRS